MSAPLEKSTSHKGGHNRSYTNAFKIQVVTYADAHSLRAAADHFKIDRNSVRDWKRNIAKYQAAPLKGKRLAGAGRKLTSEALDEKTLDWVLSQRARKLHVAVSESCSRQNISTMKV